MERREFDMLSNRYVQGMILVFILNDLLSKHSLQRGIFDNHVLWFKIYTHQFFCLLLFVFMFRSSDHEVKVQLDHAKDEQRGKRPVRAFDPVLQHYYDFHVDHDAAEYV